MKLGQRLRHLRKKHGYTLQEVGAAIGKSVSFLSDIERGEVYPSFDTLCYLAAFHGKTLSKLLKKVE